ncbi:MAG: VanZ family protein [Bythopirellula sp.]
MARPPIPLSERRQRFAPIARFATVLLMLGMFVATHIPPGTLPHHVSHIDKLLHCLVYMALTFSVLTSWELTVGQLRPQHYFTVWLVGTLYGAIDEITQIPVGRYADVSDWFFDITGIALGLTAYRLFSPLMFRVARVLYFKFAVKRA